MQGVARSQGLFSLTRDATQQFARQAPSHAGCGQIGRSLSRTAWHRSPGYDLRRTRRDLPDLIRNAAHGGIDQRFHSVIGLRRQGTDIFHAGERLAAIDVLHQFGCR